MKSAISICIITLCLVACTVKFQTTPANTETPAESIAIPNFENQSGGGPPSISQDLSEELRNYFLNNTKLEVIKDPSKGDLILTGNIISYQVAPAAAGAQNDRESAPLNRLTITLEVTYENPYNKSYAFSNKRISYFADFDANQSLSAVESQKVDEIIPELVELTFNATFDNW